MLSTTEIARALKIYPRIVQFACQPGGWLSSVASRSGAMRGPHGQRDWLIVADLETVRRLYAARRRGQSGRARKSLATS